MSNIVNEDVIEYINNTLKESKPFLKELEDYAHENAVPIIHKEVAELIKSMLLVKRPKRILEVGMAIGYSSLYFCDALNGDCHVTTMERNPKMIEIAKKNIENSPYKDNITILEGEAQEILENIEGEYDLVFMDAAKGHYKLFFDLIIDKVPLGGVIISDNILYQGMIASDKYVIRRKKTIVKRMRDYLDYICSEKEYHTSLLPMGDGVAVTYKY